MKYWRGYLAAAIFAAISWGLVQFARAHPVIVDTVYPYLTRIFQTTMTQWSAGTTVCIWQLFLLVGAVIIAGSAFLMVLLKWNPIQWFGWVVAAAFFVNMITTASYGLNAYASPLANDIRLDVSEYTVTELNQATLFFRDQANACSVGIQRDEAGVPQLPSFEGMASMAYEGFRVLTYDKHISVFASSPVPVKKLTMPDLFLDKGDSGMTVAITGEAAVNPNVPEVALPFAICKELSHRISIYSEADANFSAFLACTNNPDPIYQYSGYLMAYYYCYQALLSIPTSTAQACAASTDRGVNDLVREDLRACIDFFGEAESTANVQATANIMASDSEITLISFSSYSDVADLFSSWYIQEYIIPAYEEANKEEPFDPYDESKVDISDLVNARE